MTYQKVHQKYHSYYIVITNDHLLYSVVARNEIVCEESVVISSGDFAVKW